jgi:hypothetical protein
MRLVRPVLGLAMVLALLGAGVASALPAPKSSATSKTLFLSRAGCGTTAGEPYLLPAATADSRGCGTVGGLPVNEVEWIALEEDIDEVGVPYASTKKMAPFKIDAAKKVTGQLKAVSWAGSFGGVGTVEFDYHLVGTSTSNRQIDFGKGSVSSAVSPLAPTEVPFSITVPKAASGLTMKAFTFTVWQHGLNVPMSAAGLSGDSYIVFPARR